MHDLAHRRRMADRGDGATFACYVALKLIQRLMALALLGPAALEPLQRQDVAAALMSSQRIMWNTFGQRRFQLTVASHSRP